MYFHTKRSVATLCHGYSGNEVVLVLAANHAFIALISSFMPGHHTD